ncbi:MAG: hypothetical protein ABL893_10935 [Hyphomicrobium sp.]
MAEFLTAYGVALRLMIAPLVFALLVSAAGAAPQVSRSTPSAPILHQAAQVSPYQCGVTSSKFARICRPQAVASCRSAVARGAKGYSQHVCAARRVACVSCLAMLRRCISRIGHGPRNEFSCEECTGKFSRCIGKRYPALRR